MLFQKRVVHIKFDIYVFIEFVVFHRFTPFGFSLYDFFYFLST
jgi:hypothetical protein